jgi:hypothetical protein
MHAGAAQAGQCPSLVQFDCSEAMKNLPYSRREHTGLSAIGA